MKSDDNCSGCSHKDTCQQAYEKIGKVRGPNIALKVIVAFLVPIGVFIGVLAVSQHLLNSRLGDRALTLVSFLLALFVTLLVVFAIRAIGGPVKKEHCDKR